MDNKLENYLKGFEGYLKKLPISERIDIVKELKSSIDEYLRNDVLNADEILERLGSPKELAAGYLGEKISMGSSFNLKRLMMVISFYSLTSLTGMFIIPCGVLLAGGFMLSGIVAPIAGLIILSGFLFRFDVPFVVMNIGGYEPHPLLAFPLTIVMGVVLFLLGKVIWKAVIRYIRKVSVVKRKLDGIV